MFENPMATPRRGFLARLALVAAPLAGARLAVRTRHDVTPRQSKGPDDDWLRRLTGKHRTMFDLEQHRNGHGLSQASSMLEAWRREYKMEPPDVNLVLGARGTGLPVVLGDALWTRFRLGEQYQVTKPGTKEFYEVNPFSAANVQPGGLMTAGQTVEALQRRGVLFLACRNTMASASRRLSAAGFGPTEEIRQALEGGLLPGVVPVPAMLIAFTQMQERGISYVYVG